MLSRITACALVVLVLVPFTAPFPTCDLAALVGTHQTARLPVNLPSRATFAGDVTIANVPAISRIGRARLLEPAGLAEAPGTSVSSLTTTAATAISSRGIRDRAVFASILRV